MFPELQIPFITFNAHPWEHLFQLPRGTSQVE
jgi:hypothetical protein